MKLLTREQAEQFLKKAAQKGMVMTLDPMRSLCERMGNPQDSVPCVHIAGTNGKGSVLRMVSGCFEAAGYKTGRFFSPQVFENEPALSINGEAPDEETYLQIMSEIACEYEKMERSGMETPTVFELEALAAFAVFEREGCDIAVVECGLGGRNDATNVVRENAVCVITAVGLDHMAFLGNTAAEIAENKAGIFTSDCIAVIARQPCGVTDVLAAAAKKAGCKLRICADTENRVSRGLDGQSFDYLGERYTVPLCGAHQCDNAAAAVQAVLAMCEKGFEISGGDIKRGLAQAVWHGRFERISEKPTVILDGAHNTAAAQAFAQCVDENLSGKKRVFLFGILKDKQYAEVARIIAPKADRIITFTPPSARALDGKRLAEICTEYAPCEFGSSPENAVKAALEAAYDMGADETAICAVGSLYSLDRLRKCFESNLINR